MLHLCVSILKTFNTSNLIDVIVVNGKYFELEIIGTFKKITRRFKLCEGL